MLKGTQPGWRVYLTFLFGLIHGFGFAGVLHELGVGAQADGRGIVVPLLAFNLGVEAGQIAIASVVLPMMLRLRRSEFFLRRGVPMASCGIVVIGSCWLVERVIPA